VDSSVNTSPGTWALGEITFTGSDEGRQSDNGTFFSIVNSSNTPNNEYSGSSISITLTNQGSGDYTVVESGSEVGAAILLSPGTKVASVQIRAGIGAGNPLDFNEWSSASGLLRVIQGTDGFYTVSTAEEVNGPLVLTRTLSGGDGIIGSPENFVVTLTNVDGRP